MSISIQEAMLLSKIQSIKNTIQQDIINEALAFQTYVDGVMINSDGEFAEMLKTCEKRTNEMITSIGMLLLEALDYIDSAREAFTQVDLRYKDNKTGTSGGGPRRIGNDDDTSGGGGRSMGGGSRSGSRSYPRSGRSMGSSDGSLGGGPRRAGNGDDTSGGGGRSMGSGGRSRSFSYPESGRSRGNQ